MDSGTLDQFFALLLFLGAFLLCLSFLKILGTAGRHFKLVDAPDQRKRHTGHIPLVGGLAIFLTFVSFQWLSDANYPIIAASALLLIVGIFDDYLDLSPLLRLGFQVIVAAILVVAGGYQITTLGNLLVGDPMVLGGSIAIAFTIFCVIGVMNAINMIDGADCLAGGVVAISISALTIANLGYSGVHSVQLNDELITVLGATIAFLLFNAGLFGLKQKIFLGDSGSLFLGVLLASYFIALSQGEHAVISPVVAGWLFGLPLMDSISVMVGRVVRGISPLKAGRDHLHHQLIDSGLSERLSVAIMLAVHASLVLIGLLGDHFELSSPAMFWAFVALVVTHFFVTPRLIVLIKLRQANRRRMGKARG